MHRIATIIISLIIMCSCSSTKHTVIPYNGYAFKKDERVLVRMLDDRYSYDAKLSGQVLEKLQSCNRTMISFEDVDSKLFSKLVVFNKELVPDSSMSKRLSQAIDVDYLLTGGYLDSSKKGGLGIGLFNSAGEDNTAGGWSELHYVLLNLHTNKIVLKLIVTTTSGSMDLPDRNGDGYVTTIHSSKKVKAKKAMKILSKTFHCN